MLTEYGTVEITGEHLKIPVSGIQNWQELVQKTKKWGKDTVLDIFEGKLLIKDSQEMAGHLRKKCSRIICYLLFYFIKALLQSQYVCINIH